MLASLFDFLRDVALLAAAAGIAWWCWDQYRSHVTRHDEAARAALTAERQAVDLRTALMHLDERTADIAAEVAAGREELAAERADRAALMAAKVRVHRLLQSTEDPFLTFAEIERALAGAGRFAIVPDDKDVSRDVSRDASSEASTGAPVAVIASEAATQRVVTASSALAGDALRRVLIELVGDGVIAQLDRDRYFIASDFETGDDEDEPATAA